MDNIPNQQSDIVSVFRTECLEQPHRLAQLFDAYSSEKAIQEELTALQAAVSRSLPVLWLGMGASWCSSVAGVTALVLTGRASFAVEASEWLHFAAGVQQQVAGPILVSTSGESAELVELVRGDGHGSGILLCNQNESSCWEAAKIRLPILAGQELANATKTYTNSTAACLIIASELARQRWQLAVDRVLKGFARTLEDTLSQRNEIEEFCRAAASIEILGRGPSLAGAMMGALCVREMSAVRATAHSGGGFRHGPLLDVDSSHLAIVLALGRTADLGLRLARDCVNRGGKVVLAHGGSFKRSERLLPIYMEPVPEPWESLTSVLVSQALTLALVERNGSKYVRIQTTVE